MQAMFEHPFMQDWIASAQEEEWVLEQYEQPVATPA
jgi:glutathione S-transferase